jgi:hypothetical protein
VSATWRDESGSGPISTVFGVAIFLGFLLLATQTLVHLYASSTVSSAVFDAARRGAAEGGGGCTTAVARARTLLGDYGRRSDVEFACDPSGESLQLSFRGPTPANLIGGFGQTVGRGGIERTATVRFERFVE